MYICMCLCVLPLVSEKIRLEDDVHEGLNSVGEKDFFFPIGENFR